MNRALTPEMGEVPPGWDETGMQRRDGVRIAQDLGGGWLVIAPDKPPVVYCPCCGKVMLTKHNARLVADRIYPLEPPVAEHVA